MYGLVKDATGSTALGLLCLVVGPLVTAIAVVLAGHDRRLERMMLRTQEDQRVPALWTLARSVIDHPTADGAMLLDRRQHADAHCAHHSRAQLSGMSGAVSFPPRHHACPARRPAMYR